jgi:hypothetical protein
MTQVTNPAGRIAHAPADIKRSLVATVAIATVVVAVGIGVQALAPGTRGPVVGRVAAPPAVSAPYFGRLDPIEWNYIRQGHGLRPVVVAPPAVTAPYDGRLDPIEWTYIRQGHGLRPVVAAPYVPTFAPSAPYAPNSRGLTHRLIAQ